MAKPSNATHRLAAILFVDIAGYTALMERAEDEASRVLKRFQNVMRQSVPEHKGQIINEMGDGMLCLFETPVDAVKCAMDVHRSFSKDTVVPVRIGAHSGTVVFDSDKVYGNTVNVAARIESMGIPGAVLISRTVRNDIKNHPEIKTETLGSFQFKHVEEPLEVFAISNPGFVVPERKQLKGKFKEIQSVRKKMWLVGLLALVAMIIIGWRYFNNQVETKVEVAKSIAVLPFENVGSEDDAYFAVGMAEDVLTQISKISGLKVLSRFTIKEYDPKGKTPAEIGQELKVAHLLAGSIRRVGTELRIACQLINTEDQTESWAETFDRQYENVFEIQSEVAQQVASQLKAKLSEEEMELLNQAPTDNLEAYNHFLRGRDIFDSQNDLDNEKAIAHYQEALRLDSNLAIGWAALANAYSLAVYSYGNRTRAYLDTARMFAEKAVELTPMDARCWNALGLAYDVQGRYQQAIKMYSKALELNPNSSTALANLSIILNDQGLIGEATLMQKRSIEIDPLSPTNYNSLAVNYRDLGMYEEAIEQLELALAIDPDNWISIYYIAYCHILNESPTRAVPFIERLVQMNPGNARFLEIAGELSHYFDPEMSRSYFEQALETTDFDPTINFFTPVGIGYHLWESGDRDSANVWFNQSLEYHIKQMENGSQDLNHVMFRATVHGIRGENIEAIELLRDVHPVALDYMSWTLSPMSAELRKDGQFLHILNRAKDEVEQKRMVVLESRGMGDF